MDRPLLQLQDLTALIALGVVALSLCTGCAPPAAEPESEPAPSPAAARHLLLITIDTLRADHLGFHGYPRDTSPFLDRLAAESVVFEDAAVQVPKTLPSTISMLTSLYPGGSGVETNRHVLPEGVLTLAEVLRDAGFATTAWTTNGNLVAKNGVDQGFDRFIFLPPPSDAAALTDRVLEELAGAAEDPRRRFLWLHYIDPHGPYTPPEPLAERFVGDAFYDGAAGVRLTLDEGRRINWNQGLGGVPHYQRQPFLDHPRRRQRDFYIARYDAEIRYLDGELERLLSGLEERGLLADTVLVLTADHGEAMGEREYFFEHGWFVSQDQVHVPWLIRLPATAGAAESSATPVPRRVGVPVELLDLAPTVLDLLGVAIPGVFQGRSLRPLLEGGEVPRRPLYAITPDSYPHRYASVRLGPWKLVRLEKGRKRAGLGPVVGGHQLFNLDQDPGELIDRAAERPELVAELLRILGSGPWHHSAGAETTARSLDPEELDAEVRENLRSLGYL